MRPMDVSRRRFLERAAVAAALGLSGPLSPLRGYGEARLRAQARQTAPPQVADLHLVNGRFHTMDAATRVVSQVWIRNGRFAGVGNNLSTQGNPRRVDLRGRTVIPGIVDAHNHIVLVGNRPGWHTPLEHVFTIPDAIAALKARVKDVPAGEIITCIGPLSAMQFAENRLPTLTELDAVPRPVYLQAAQGGARVNSAAKAWLESKGVMVGTAEGVLAGQAAGLVLQTLRKELLTAETRKRTAAGALEYYASLGITTHRDSGAFHADAPATGIASENTYTMHEPFLALMREGRLAARLRFDFLHQDSPTANPPLPTLSDRLKNSFPFFGNDWVKTGGIGEFTGGGIEGLKAIARAGWRGEDHSLNLINATHLITDRETVNKEIPIGNLRWILSHIPGFNEDLANRAHAMGMGVLVGWGPTRTGANVGPPYRMLMSHPIRKAFHSDGGDITVINPWLNFHTMITGKNLIGQDILGEQKLTRQETLWMATAATKWFIREDDLGSIEAGNHADLAVLDRDYFTIPDDDIKRVRSLMTVVGGRVVHGTL
jgi:predicted amidohydrolase YtcJ